MTRGIREVVALGAKKQRKYGLKQKLQIMQFARAFPHKRSGGLICKYVWGQVLAKQSIPNSQIVLVSFHSPAYKTWREGL